VLLSLLLFLYNSSDATRNGLSVHPMVPRVSTSVPTRLTIAPTLAIFVPSVHLMVSFLFLFFLIFDP
jgi:hypothetical protein